MRDVVIVSAARTAVGNYGGTLKDTPASTLGAVVVKEVLNRAGVKPEMVDEVIMGCVLQGGLGQNIARQVAMEAGLPKEIPSMTLNKVCGSGLRSVSLAAQIIKAGCDRGRWSGKYVPSAIPKQCHSLGSSYGRHQVGGYDGV